MIILLVFCVLSFLINLGTKVLWLVVCEDVLIMWMLFLIVCLVIFLGVENIGDEGVWRMGYYVEVVGVVGC